ncbi:hypothetical protein MTBPR1_30334 [Candidatus Terasakiella magnetica]|uniref:Uncharacterized protein n=1 Tax=Candidatus Terasakiella magnetica TaxID=1867952 RepID=A0A1C3RIC6_9PROT|nr:hypothetical protein MTBPR1_30334 [Candidatus Terasakiella magnetica]
MKNSGAESSTGTDKKQGVEWKKE